MRGLESHDGDVDDLYRLLPEDFVAERTKLADRTRAAGDELGAARIRHLDKPTIGAYWCNQIAFRWPEELAALLALGDELREATAERNRERLLVLDRRRRVQTDALLSLLWHLGEDEAAQGRRRPSAESLTRVGETLTAAVMDPQTAQQVRAGRLTRTAVHEGFGLDLLDSQALEEGTNDGEATLVTHLPVLPITGSKTPGMDTPTAREFQIQRAAAELVDAEQRLSAAADTVDSLSSMLEALEQEIAALEGDRDAARDRLEVWRRSVDSAERAVRSARRRLDALTGDL